MATLYKSLFIFGMNWLDAHLTILWVRLNVATEGNGLMAMVLNMGEAQFVGVKVIVGAFAAIVLYRCSHLPLARRGMKLVLGVYLAIMAIHLVTGFYALGWQAPMTVIAYFVELPTYFIGFLF